MNQSRRVFLLIVVVILASTIYTLRRQKNDHQSLASIFSNALDAAKQKEWNQIDAAIESLDASPAFKAHAHLLKGIQSAHLGDNSNALVELSKANEHPDTRVESYYQAAKICYSITEFREATNLLAKALEWEPDHVDAHRLMASVWYDLGTMERALGSLDEVIRLAPEDYRPYYMKGVIFHDYERFSEAIEQFQTAITKTDAQANSATQIRIGWSDALIRLRRYDEALEVLQDAQRSDVVAIRRAEAFMNLRRFDEAEAIVDTLLKSKPHDVDLAIVAATIYENSNREADALNVLKQAMEFSPKEIRLLNAAATASGAMGDVEGARKYRESAMEIGKLAEKFSLLHQSAVDNSDDAMLRLELGKLAEQLGKRDIARTWYAAAYGMAPENPEIQSAWKKFQTEREIPQTSTPNRMTPVESF